MEDIAYPSDQLLQDQKIAYLSTSVFDSSGASQESDTLFVVTEFICKFFGAFKYLGIVVVVVVDVVEVVVGLVIIKDVNVSNV